MRRATPRSSTSRACSKPLCAMAISSLASAERSSRSGSRGRRRARGGRSRSAFAVLWRVGGGTGVVLHIRLRRRVALRHTRSRSATCSTCPPRQTPHCIVPSRQGVIGLKRRPWVSKLQPLSLWGRQASTGLARVLLRAQVLSHLVNQLGLYTSQL